MKTNLTYDSQSGDRQLTLGSQTDSSPATENTFKKTWQIGNELSNDLSSDKNWPVDEKLRFFKIHSWTVKYYFS